MSAERVATVLAALRERGERITVARRVVLTALDEAPDHCSAEQLASVVNRLHPEIHRATIYRTLEALTRLEVVEHTHLGHGPAVYHLADRAHQHLVCDQCGSVTEVPAAAFSDLEHSLRRDYGFQMESRHFALAGLCQDCAQASGGCEAPSRRLG